MISSADIKFINENIKNENKASEILSYIQANNINPNENLFVGKNLFHLAIQQGNLNLIKLLYEKKLIDVNLKTKNGTLALGLLAPYESPEHDEILSFLLNETNINLSATDDLGFTAAAWAERRRNFLLMHKLLPKEPPTLIGHKIYDIKMLQFKFGLGEDIQVNNPKLPNGSMDFRMEGYLHTGTVPDLQASFNNFIQDQEVVKSLSSQELSTLVSVNKNIQKNTLYRIAQGGILDLDQTPAIQKCYQAYQSGEMVAIHGGAGSHAASVVLHGTHLYRCNKGGEKHPDYSIVKYQIMDPSEVDEDLIRKLLTSIHPEKHLNLTELDGIKGKAQYVGNCTVASPKKAIQAMIYAQVAQDHPPALDHKAIARSLYKKWTAWDRNHQLGKFLSSWKDTPEGFSSVLKNILYDTARFSKSHAKLARALYKQLNGLFEPAFKDLPHPFIPLLEIKSINKRRRNKKTPSNFKKLQKKYLYFMEKANITKFNNMPEECAILFAVASGDNEALKQYFKKPNRSEEYLLTLPGKHKLSCMHLAVLWGNDICLETLIHYHPEFINTANQNSFTPLHMAISSGQPHLVELLLKNGADMSLNGGAKMDLSVDKLLEEVKDKAIAQKINECLLKNREKKSKFKR